MPCPVTSKPPLHAIIEHHWGDFKHDPLAVLHKYFDGFLYWANWGAPKLAFRFPYGILPADLLHDYNLEEFVTFTRHSDYDILDLHKRVARSIWYGPTSSPCFILCLFRFAWRLAFCRARIDYFGSAREA